MSTTEQDPRRSQVHAMWAGVASRWAEHADDVDERAAALTEAMLDRTEPQPGERVLEVECGPGGAGLAAAERVGSEAEIAGARAVDRGLVDVRTATLDLEAVDQPDDSYDVVLCREGLMFAVEPERAAAEIHRVLRPGGRAALAVWGTPDANPWLGLVFDAVGEQLGMTVPPPGIPGPFSLADPARLQSLLDHAGFEDVAVVAVPTPLPSPSFDAWWARTRQVAGPLATILADLPDETTTAIADRLRTAVEPYTRTDGSLELPGEALLAAGRRPQR